MKSKSTAALLAFFLGGFGAYVATGVFAKDHIAQVDEMVDDNLTDKERSKKYHD